MARPLTSPLICEPACTQMPSLVLTAPVTTPRAYTKMSPLALVSAPLARPSTPR